MENKKSFGGYLRSKRMEFNLTQKEFADKLYVTESAVSKWERGLSYPDITLIGDICGILQVSEHELLTASEDVETRSNEKIAKRYIKMINRIKIAQYLIYGIALLTCFICNIAIQHSLSWFFIVLAAEATSASLTLLPVLVQKKRGIITLLGFTTSLVMLLLVCCVYTGGDWFFMVSVSVVFGFSLVFLPFAVKGIWLPQPYKNHSTLIYFIINSVLLFFLLLVIDLYTGEGVFINVSFPIALFSLTLPWSMMLIIRYTKINGFFKTAGCIFVTGIFQFCINFTGVIGIIIGEKEIQAKLRFDFFVWNEYTINDNINTIILLSFAAGVLLFTISGIITELIKFNKKNIE